MTRVTLSWTPLRKTSLLSILKDSNNNNNINNKDQNNNKIKNISNKATTSTTKVLDPSPENLTALSMTTTLKTNITKTKEHKKQQTVHSQTATIPTAERLTEKIYHGAHTTETFACIVTVFQ